MTLTRYLKALRRLWMTVLIATAVGLVLGLGSALILPKSYEAQSTIFVNVSESTTVQDLQMGEQFAQARAASYAAIGTSSRVLDPVAEEIGGDVDASALAEDVTVTNSPNTAVITVTGTDGDAQRAADITAATAESLVRASAELEGASDSDSSPVQLSIMQEAVVPEDPAAPSVPLNLLVGAVVGLVVGLLIVLARAGSARRAEA
ncbi:polysaccharide biosynthesis protein [Kocuria coralli]|uniref:Polysaccharide biosynthesis protein n=1 Tax=Kocuria coralli TaxID=1461025 RepID=A0A5J5KTN1_9MICC|nr:Wzz/FepE/Etk N-terminal domain-containing protein [Kocuria coralli]KAA9393137.1 polysaccharide biosynthesis protein [Kocuria coralli]